MGPDVRSHLERIIASTIFSRSERLCRFLRLAVERTLEGNGDQLKEYVIGVEVFGRPREYDPRLDPIVRVEARRLRSKLRRYYEVHGEPGGLRIDFPRGSYTPTFQSLPAAQIERDSIVVLPFTSLNPEVETDTFTNGLAVELIHTLTQVEGLRVVAAGTMFHATRPPRDLRRIGQKLNVRTALDGSVSLSGDRVRVAAQLVEMARGEYLWAEVYDLPMGELFSVQDRLTRQIASALRLKLGPARSAIQDPETYRLYLEARYHLGARREHGLLRAVELASQAVARDPLSARAHAALAQACALQALYGVVRPRQCMPRARNEARRALELDESLAEAHTALALVSALYDWRWRDAETHFRQALALNPGYAEAHSYYAFHLLAPHLRLDEALAHAGKAAKLDPLSPVTAANEAELLMMRGDYAAAIEICSRLMEQDAASYRTCLVLARAYLHQGSLDEAAVMADRARTLSGNMPYATAVLAHTHALLGHGDEAERLRLELESSAARRYVPSLGLALIAFGLGEQERALDLIEQAALERESSVVFVAAYRASAGLSKHPRIQALLGRMGLPAA